MKDRKQSGQGLLIRISNILEDMHCSGCPADMHCDFWKRHIEALSAIKNILMDYKVEPCASCKIDERELWNE